MLNNEKKSLSCSKKSLEYCRYCPLLFLLGNSDSFSLILKFICCKIEYCTRIRCICQKSEFFFYYIGKFVGNIVITMNYKHMLRAIFKALHPVHKSFLVSVSRNTLKLQNLRSYFNGFTEKLDFFSTVNKCSSGCSY